MACAGGVSDRAPGLPAPQPQKADQTKPKRYTGRGKWDRRDGSGIDECRVSRSLSHAFTTITYKVEISRDTLEIDKFTVNIGRNVMSELDKVQTTGS